MKLDFTNLGIPKNIGLNLKQKWKNKQGTLVNFNTQMKKFVKNFWQSFIYLNQEMGKQTNNQTNDTLHNIRNRDKFGKHVYTN